MMALSPVSAALPTVANDMGVSPTIASWAVTSFLLTLVALLLTSGRLGDLFGHQRVFFWGTVIYTVTGTLCGFTQDILQLIILRALQGVGTAFISGNSLAILVHKFTSEERGKAVGIAGMAASLGALIGVLISSVFAQYLSWRWLYFSVLPLGLLSIKAALDLHTNIQPAQKPRIDARGALVLGAMLAVFTLAFSHLHSGPATFDAGAPYHLVMLGTTAVLGAGFLRIETRHPQPMIEFRHLRHLLFATSVSANGIMHMTMMGSVFLVPFLVERGLGLTPLHTAGMLIITQIANMAASPFSGWLYDRTGWRFLPPVAMVVLSASLIALGIFAESMPYWGFLVISLAMGVGLGFFMTPNNTVIMGTLPAAYRGFAAGMLETSRQLGHTLGVSASSAVLGVVLVTSLPAVSENAAYLTGFQWATLAAGFIALVGALLSVISSRAPALQEVLD